MPLRSESKEGLGRASLRWGTALDKGIIFAGTQHESSPKNLQKHPWENLSARPKEHSTFSWQSRTFLPLFPLFPPIHVYPRRLRNSSYWVREKEKKRWGKERKNRPYFILEGRWLICCQPLLESSGGESYLWMNFEGLINILD